jgi:hypothetical protein
MADIIKMDEAGLRGASNYELWLGQGNTGTVEEYLEFERADLQDLVNAADEAADRAETAAGTLDPTSFETSKAIWGEVIKVLYPTTFVDKAFGSDGNSGDHYYAAKATESAGYTASADGETLLLKNGQTHAIPKTAMQFGNLASSGLPRHMTNFGGDGESPPLLDARQDLSGKTWTLVSGKTNAWETTATLQDTPIHAGVNVANSSKYALYLDVEDPDIPGGIALDWHTGGANVAANDTAIDGDPSSWGINLTGSTAGDIRTTGINTTGVRIVVNMPDSSDPNGKPLRLSDRQAVATFYGGRHGHLSMIGGSQKDNVSYQSLSGDIPTFQGIRALDMPCHGGVGPRNVIGEYYARGKPSPGVPLGDSEGRTLGGGLHLFSAVDLSSHDITIGSFDVANFTQGMYAHGSVNLAYHDINVLRRSTVANCSQAVQLDGGPASGTSLITGGLYLHGGIDITGGEIAFRPVDELLWYINGGSWVPDSTPVSNRATLLNIVGKAAIHLKDFDVDMSAINTVTPTFMGRTLLQWSPYYGTATAIANSWFPTVILDNVQDLTTIDTGVGRRKVSFYGAEASTPHNARVHLELRNGTTLGDLWNGSTTWATYPESLITESGTTIGFGGKTRAQVRTAMDALGKTHSISNGTTMVDGSGNVVDAGI